MGDGGNIDSTFFCKMRMTFVDTYNLITVQCDYFVNQFMDTEKPEQVKMIYSMPNILYHKKMKET